MRIKGLLTKSNLIKIASTLISVALSLGMVLFLILYSNKKGALQLLIIPYTLSHESGVYKDPFELEIFPAQKNVEIRYTTDGSDPDEKSILYENNIKINDSSVIKFRFFSNGTPSAKVNTIAYVLNTHTVPIVVLITDPKNLWDKTSGIYVVGNDIKNPNYSRKGDEWKKPAEFFYFDENGKKAIQMSVEIRVSGGATRSNAQKAFRICAKKEFGYKSINYDFFGEGSTKQHKCILLRASGNDWPKTMFRDVLAQSLVYETDVDTQNHKASVLYLNGQYWGIHNIREFYDDQYLKYKYGTKKESVVIIEPDRKRSGIPVVRDGMEGDEKAYVELLENVDDYEYLQTHIDISNYIDYFLINIYTGNDDWPDNNIRVWRLKTDLYPNMSVQPLDGKWRWLLFDLDCSFGLDKMNNYNINTLEMATRKTIYSDNSKKEEKWPTAIIRTLLTDENFVNSFINRYADLLNTNFSVENVWNKIQKLKATYKPEIPMHVDKWGGALTKANKQSFKTLEEWESNVQVLENFALNRTKYAREHVVDYFKLEGTFEIVFNSDAIQGGTVKINTIDSNNTLFKKELTYFKNIPVTIEAKPNFGWKFVSWGNDELGKEKKQIVKFNKNIYLKPEFKLTWWGSLLNKL